MRRFVMLGAVAITGVGPIGCAPRDVSQAAETLQEHGLVQLDVTYSRDLDSTAGVSLDAEAHFVRYRTTTDLGESVAALLGITSPDELATGTCRNVDAPEPTGAANVDVALLDAGPLTLRNDGATETILEPYHYPEILPFVTGVVYGQRASADGQAAAAREPVALAKVEVEGEGGEDVGPFVASATLSRGFPELVVSRGARGLELGWTAFSPTASVLVELHWTGAHPGSLRCRTSDDGALDLTKIAPAASLAGLEAALVAGGSAEVSVARTAQSTVVAPGAGSGRLLVTLRDAASVPTR